MRTKPINYRGSNLNRLFKFPYSFSHLQIFSAIRNLAERERLFSSNSSLVGLIAFLVTNLKTGCLLHKQTL